MKRALITGVNGQDGSYLAEFLLNKGYEVYGFCREKSLHNLSNLIGRINFILGDVVNNAQIKSAIINSRPDEIYNLASQSSPSASWISPVNTMHVNGMAAVSLFDAVRDLSPGTKIFHASSSEMFGKSSGPQSELGPFSPQNPYAASKVYAHNMACIYRECYGSFIANGILFNHESSRRPLNFVVQKIAFGAACAALKIQTSVQKNEIGKPLVENSKLALGNLEISKDWGHSKDFVRAMWLMLQHDKPDDFIVGTGVLHSLKDVCSLAYSHVGLDWTDYIVSKKELTRPIESTPVLADHSKASRVLDWNPTISFEQMIGEMVDEKLLYLAN